MIAESSTTAAKSNEIKTWPPAPWTFSKVVTAFFISRPKMSTISAHYEPELGVNHKKSSLPGTVKFQMTPPSNARLLEPSGNQQR